MFQWPCLMNILKCRPRRLHSGKVHQCFKLFSWLWFSIHVTTFSLCLHRWFDQLSSSIKQGNACSKVLSHTNKFRNSFYQISPPWKCMKITLLLQHPRIQVKVLGYQDFIQGMSFKVTSWEHIRILNTLKAKQALEQSWIIH